MGRATRNIDKNNPQKSAQIVQDSKGKYQNKKYNQRM